MSLSNDLISQFVKVNQTETKTQTKKSLLGTVCTDTGYVQIDGSETTTPIHTTSTLIAGDRVTVSIEDHTAIVTGNLTNPSATEVLFDGVSANYATVGQLSSAVARIDTLEADNVTINGTLNSQTADIATLKTTKLNASDAKITYATIDGLNSTNATIQSLVVDTALADRLTAAEADIDDLETDRLTASAAAITYAKITDLDSTNTNITNLEADVGNINTLIFGSASGDTIQTTFANAVIAQLGDAQIKSAMIDSLSASKITTGDIITNNVSVKSEDGSLVISDETMQISDNTRVRVQIGKDASDDYSINIWDADGNLMFSAGGITDSAIKDAIIRNDMVSDTANIAAHKLDIDSLFTEINGSTNTIKSTQIYLDDKEQTLDVAFETISSDVEDLQNELSSQGTQITAIQGQISTKVWQSDIDTATNTLSTQYSELEQEVDSLSTTVASHTTTLTNKADSTTVTAVSNRVTTLESDLDGFKTTVASTYATKSSVDDIDDRLTAAETSISQTDDSITALASRTTVVEDKFNSYSTTEEMNSAITQSANSITTSVSETYATITDLSDDISFVQSSTDLVDARVTTAESLIEQLSDCIAVLVTDGNGESLMVQTEDGWTFSTASIESMIEAASENLSSLTDELGDVGSTVDVLQQAVDDLGVLTDYIKIGTYEDEPCIELGESDSDFKLRITNTRIIFMEGSGVPAYFTNQSMHIKKAVIEEELQQGGFVWTVRNNGNMGLIWKGVSS